MVLALRLTEPVARLQFAEEMSVVWQLCGLSVSQLVVTVVYEAFPVPSLPRGFLGARQCDVAFSFRASSRLLFVGCRLFIAFLYTQLRTW